jgi:hypothetical protein
VKSICLTTSAIIRFAGAAATCLLTIAPVYAQLRTSPEYACADNCTAPAEAPLGSLDQSIDGQQVAPQDVPMPGLAEEQFASLGGDTVSLAQSNVGYIDSAIIRSQVRMRFDAAYGMNRPDRAEYYYTTWEAFGGRMPNPPLGQPDPNVDFQLISTYLEYALTDRFSVFADVPVLFNNPSRNENHAGLGDMIAGFRWGLSNCCDRQLTFQLKNYFPTGDDDAWLSAGHYSIEPGLLYYQQLSDRVTLEAEFKDWISVDGAVNPQNGDPYAGNVLQYGIGLGYNWRQRGHWTITPIVEFVGWTVLEGQVFEFDELGNELGPADAAGDTIVNVKLGARITDCCGGGFYAGYGRSLTGDRWYEEIVRIEFRRPF